MEVAACTMPAITWDWMTIAMAILIFVGVVVHAVNDHFLHRVRKADLSLENKRLAAQIAELKRLRYGQDQMPLPSCVCDGECQCQDLEGLVVDMRDRLEHAHALMERGFNGEARHEIERVLEDAEVSVGAW